MKRFPLEGVILLYFLSYLPNVIITKLVTSTPHSGLGRPLTGAANAEVWVLQPGTSYGYLLNQVDFRVT